MAAYFITIDGMPFVKIGQTANPLSRLRTLSAWSPFELRLAAWDDSGDELTEAELHWRFRSAAHRNEWFWLSPEIRQVIEVSRQHGVIPDAWYLPSYWTRRRNAPKGISFRLLEHKFGLTQQRIAELIGLPGACQYRDVGVTVRYAPLLYEHLRAQFPGIKPHDLFDLPANDEEAA
jgi:hypothetical protein